jgi:diketogulonate reductase-like aldo/keto reductase
MNIPTVELRNGLQMPVIGLGTSLRGKQLSNHDIFVESVKYALSIGYRHIDTAKAYNNEHLIARAISVRFVGS